VFSSQGRTLLASYSVSDIWPEAEVMVEVGSLRLEVNKLEAVTIECVYCVFMISAWRSQLTGPNNFLVFIEDLCCREVRSAEMSTGINVFLKLFFLSGNNPLMSFKHLRMLNSASKCHKITLKAIELSKPERTFSKKSS
jgi:hypothetical protein